MFHLHYDTRLDRLAEHLSAQLADRRGGPLLAPDLVLVPQPGLQRWLVQRLAERYGIAANLEFLAPAQLVWRLLRAADDSLPEQSAFDREVLAWRILERVQRGQAPAGLSALFDGPPRELRRYELATHMAGLFDRYQAYRRDMLEAWERGEDADDVQAQLWRDLVADSGQASRAALMARLLRRHAGADAPAPAGLPWRVFAFGCINVSPDVLRVLGLIGRHVPLHFYLPTPCREYWGDVPDRRDLRARLGEFGGTAFDEPAHPLLVSLGGVGRDFVAQLFAYDEVQPDFESDPLQTEPPRRTLLQRVQADIITLSAPDPARAPELPADHDDSLQVHVCHSPLREVQVLHDRLLDLFERHPDLEPRDVAVMVPKMSAYAPCIEAVFGALDGGDARYVPWTIADRPASDVHALVALFERLLSLPASRLAASEVLEVLAVPAVMRAAGIDDADLEQLRAWLAESGVRWGEDAAEREAQGLPPFEAYSWRFGRRRLLLGYMAGAAAEAQLIDGSAPLTDIEGGRASALGQLLRVQRVLRELRAEQRRPRAASDWQALLNRALDALLPEPDGRDEERALDAVREALAALAEHTRLAGLQSALDWMTVRAFLRERLESMNPPQRFLAGGVSVCGLVPLRNVPFKVICVLGLDAESFPRRDPADALNRLLSGRRRPGDRSLRDDDRYLFLQTLMAARRVLYLSYSGIEPRDGSEREPSVVLAELLDVVSEGYFGDAGGAREALVQRHPMQPFSAKLFPADAADARQFTYRHEWQAAAQVHPRGEPTPAFVNEAWSPAADASAEAVIDIAELVRFFRHPAAAFLRRQTKLALPGDSVTLADREPLTLDALTAARIDRVLVGHGRVHGDVDGMQAVLAARALLPPLAWGEEAYTRRASELLPQVHAWHAWQQEHGARPPERISLSVHGVTLSGVLEGLHEGGYAGWVGSAGNGGNWMHWWIGALVAVARHGPLECVAFGRGKDRLKLFLPLRVDTLTRADVHAHLAALLALYRQGQSGVLALPARTAFAWAWENRASGEPTDKAARAAWEGNSFMSIQGEADDPAWQLAMRGRDLFAPGLAPLALADAAHQAYGPLVEALHGGQLL